MSLFRGQTIAYFGVILLFCVGACSGCELGETADVDDDAQREAIRQAASDLDDQIDGRLDEATRTIEEAIDEATRVDPDDEHVDQAAAD